MLSEAKHLSLPASIPPRIILISAVAILAGLLIAVLPITYSATLFGGSVLLIAVFVEPLIGMLLMIAVGLAEPLLAAAGLLPFPYSQVAFLFVVAAWLLKGIMRREIRWPSLPITKYFFLYLSATALSVFFTQPASPKDAATELWKWAQMYFIAGLVYDLAGRKKIGWVVVGLLLLGGIEAGIGIWQFQFRGHGPDGFRILGDHWRAYGTLEQPNPFAGLMGLVWPLAAMIALSVGFTIIQELRKTQTNTDRTQINPDKSNQKNQRLSFQISVHLRSLILLTLSLVAAITLTALFLSYSRGSWVGAAAAAFVMLIFWPRKRWIGFGLGAAALLAFFALYTFNLLPPSIANRFADVGDFVQVYDVRGVHINNTNFAIVERLAHWQAAFNMVDAQPLFGVGFGNYESTYEHYRLAAWRYGLGHAHNIYLNVLAETGVIGFGAYLIFWSGIIWITLRSITHPSTPLLSRTIALGLLGCWVHLATHQLLDNLYVGNIPLYLGALFSLLCLIAQPPVTTRSTQSLISSL